VVLANPSQWSSLLSPNIGVANRGPQK
jgi:hypothetical protein